MKRLEDKVFFIAGAGGLGNATAQRLAQEGATTVIGNRHIEKARAAAREIEKKGGRALACTVDIAEDESVAKAIALTIDTFGGLDGLLANAAELSDPIKAGDTNILDMPLESLDGTLRVNLRGYILCTRHALPHLLARGGGTLLYTSSDAAYTGRNTGAAYSISKAGIHALVRHVAFTWGKQRIRANAIVPGLIMTDSASHRTSSRAQEAWLEDQCSFRLGKPDDFVAMAALLFSDEGEWITGQAIVIDGGYVLCR